MTTARFTGRLAASYSVTVPGQPGWAQPDRHHANSAGGGVDRDDAPAGGGWQPDAWTAPPDSVLTGSSDPHTDDRNHRRRATHRGPDGLGYAQERVVLESDDTITGGPSGPAPLLGAGGAAFGGLRHRGSADWQNTATVRRRADGGTVTRPAGFRMGYRYVPISAEHRQGRHENRPTLRGVRERNPLRSDRTPLRSMGVLRPNVRQTIAPTTTGADFVSDDGPASTSIIGSEWSL